MTGVARVAVYSLLAYIALVGLQLTLGWFAGAQLAIGVALLLCVAAASKAVRQS